MPKRTKQKKAVAIGNRANYPKSSATIGGLTRHPHLKYVSDGMSSQQRTVFNAMTKCQTGYESVLRGSANVCPPSAQNALGWYGGRRIDFNGGLPFSIERSVEVTVGTQGWGLLVIDHRLTAWSGSDKAAGTAWSTNESIDCWTTSSAWTGDLAAGYALSTINPAVGVTGLAPISSLGHRGYDAPAPVTTGDYGCAVEGQLISLVTDSTDVSSRKGKIYQKSSPAPLPATLIKSDLTDDPRVSVTDATALTEPGITTLNRHPSACGYVNYMAGGSNGHGPTGTFQMMGQGHTLIAIQATTGAVFTFKIKTVGIWAGVFIPIEKPICYNSHAYAAVTCAMAHMSIDNVVDDEDRSRKFREAYKKVEETVSSQTPSFLAEIGTFLSESGVKLAKHMGSSLMKTLLV